MKPTTRDLIHDALVDAIMWQDSLAAAHHPGSPERHDAREQAKAYATTVTLQELRERVAR